jgi:hypothetical protein
VVHGPPAPGVGTVTEGSARDSAVMDSAAVALGTTSGPVAAYVDPGEARGPSAPDHTFSEARVPRRPIELAVYDAGDGACAFEPTRPGPPC